MGNDHERRAHRDNARAWDQAAEAYARTIDRTVAALRRGEHSMVDAELPLLLPLVRGVSLAVHLQCAAGEDTLSLALLGARRVVGVDISAAMIALARETASRSAIAADFIESDVLDVPHHLDGTAELVYTGRGALIWIHDLDAWAAAVARLLAPGGALYVFEGHPITYAFDPRASALTIDPTFTGYFGRTAYTTTAWPAEYVGELQGTAMPKHEVAWPVSDVISALLAVGLTLEAFREHPEAFWPEFPHLPATERTKIPNTYSLVFRKRR